MKLNRIKAIIKRHVIQMFRDFARLFDMVYWPLIDIILWGFTSIWFVEKSETSINFGFILLSSLILWGVMWRSNVDISISLLDEIFSKNVVNLFSSPLTLREWSVSMMLLGFVRAVVVFLYTALLVWFIYAWNVFSLGYTLIPCFLLLLVSGWCIGFLVAGLLIYYGQRFQAFVWGVGWIFSIVAAVFFPLSVLPRWMQIICKSFPMAYVFEAIRKQVETGVFPWDSIGYSLALNAIYFSLALLFFKFMFDRSRSLGLSLVEVD